MELKELVNFVYLKRKEYERQVRKESKRLSLNDVLRIIDSNFHPTYYKYEQFNKEDILEILLYNEKIMAYMTYKSLILKGKYLDAYSLSIAKFNSKKIEPVYRKLSEKIFTARRNGDF